MVCWNMLLNKRDWRETPWNVNINLSQFELQTITWVHLEFEGVWIRLEGQTAPPPPRTKNIPWTPLWNISGSARDFLIYKRLGHICICCVKLINILTQRQCKENVLTSLYKLLKVQMSKAFKAFVIIMIYFVCVHTHTHTGFVPILRYAWLINFNFNQPCYTH